MILWHPFWCSFMILQRGWLEIVSMEKNQYYTISEFCYYRLKCYITTWSVQLLCTFFKISVTGMSNLQFLSPKRTFQYYDHDMQLALHHSGISLPRWITRTQRRHFSDRRDTSSLICCGYKESTSTEQQHRNISLNLEQSSRMMHERYNYTRQTCRGITPFRNRGITVCGFKNKVVISQPWLFKTGL